MDPSRAHHLPFTPRGPRGLAQERRAKVLRARREQRGTALAFSLISVMLIASLGAGLLQMQRSIDRKMDFAVDRRRALYLAEAGIAEAALAVTSGRSGVIASKAVPASFGKGVYWVESDDLPDDRISLRCTAQVGSAELAIQSMILPSVNPVTSLGVFGIDGVRIGWGTRIDGYHSGRGDFESQRDPSAPVESTGRGGLLGSDCDVVLEENLSVPFVPLATPTYIFGNIKPGHDNHVISSGRPQLRGSVEPYDAPPYLPEITLPDPDEVIAGDFVVEDDQVGIGATMSTHVQGNVVVELDATLTINGPMVLRCTSLILDGGATLNLDDSTGPIHIYAEEGLDFGHGSTLKSTAAEQDSRGTYLLIPGSAAATDRVIMDCGGSFHGAIYAPDDIVSIKKELRWIGSIVARYVMTAPGAHITVDRRLTLGNDGFPSLPRQLSWQLVALGDQIARRIPLEPRLALAMRGVSPVPSSTAGLETHLEIQYEDAYDRPALFRGAFAAFDPKSASRIVGARWEDPRDGEMRGWTVPTGSESTGAVEGLRNDLRDLRALVQASIVGVDVATLTDDQAIEAAATAAAAGTVTTQPDSVQRAVQRTDETEEVKPPALPTAIRAADAARGFADQAQALLDAAAPYELLPMNADAGKALKELHKKAAKVIAKADDARKYADKAAVTTGKRQDKEAEKAVKRTLDAKDELDKAQIEFDAFMAAV